MSSYTRMAGDKLKEYEGYFRNSDSSSPVSDATRANLSPSASVTNANPIDTDVKGNNNNVTNNQDNSVTQTTIDNTDNRRYYGGSSRTFNYQGGGGLSELYDSPVSKATMGGYYDTDDSPAASAKFYDLHTDLNNQYQRAQLKQNREEGTGTFDHNSDVSRAMNPAMLLKDIREAPSKFYKQSDKKMAQQYGDVWNYKMPDWKMPMPGAPIEYQKPDSDVDDNDDD